MGQHFKLSMLFSCAVFTQVELHLVVDVLVMFLVSLSLISLSLETCLFLA